MDNATIAQLTTFASVIVGLFYQAWRDERRRKWDVEDRLSIAATLAKHTTATAATVAEALAARATETSAKLEGLIAENTKISTDAFHEANTVNLKLEKLGLEHNRLDKMGLATALKENK